MQWWTWTLLFDQLLCHQEQASAQKAESTALTQALRLEEWTTANIYTESRYVFALAHVHGSIYKENGLLTAKGKTFKK